MGPWLLIVNEALRNIELLIFLMLCMCFLFYFLTKRMMLEKINIYISLCDPLILALILPEITASIVPIYMYVNDWMYRPNEFFYSYVSTEIAFWLGLLLIAGIRSKNNYIDEACKVSETDINNKKKLYIIYVVLYFFVRSIYFYNCGGFPLFSDEYYTFFFERSPVSTRLSIDLYLIVAILWVDSFDYIKNKKFNYLIGLMIIVTYALSGQKGLILNLVKALFFVEVYRIKMGKPLHDFNAKKALIVLGVVCFFILLPLYFMNMNNEKFNLLMAMVIRLIGNGDSFPLFYGLPSTASILFENTGVFNYIWANMASFHFKFGYNTDYIPTTELKWIMDNTLGAYVVPLIRHNIIAIKVFGIEFGWIYSLILGCIIGWFTRYVFKRISGFNFYMYLIICLIYEAVIEMIAIYQVALRFEAVILNAAILALFYIIFEKKAKGERIIKGK